MKNGLVIETDTISLWECKDGFWLYDETRGMNLAMRAPSSDLAFLEALEYYQGRLLTVESALKVLKDKVDLFVSSLEEEEE